VEVTPNAALLVMGDTIRLSATPMGAAGAALSNRAIAWSSENQTVATVSTDNSAAPARARAIPHLHQLSCRRRRSLGYARQRDGGET
jgi:hypothetical protein